MATKVIPKTELRDRIRTELAELGDDSILITERGRPLAVVVAVGRWNEIHERIEDLEDAIAILEHRSRPGGDRPAAKVFASIEREESHLPDPAHQVG